jgi:hypothetical protein
LSRVSFYCSQLESSRWRRGPDLEAPAFAQDNAHKKAPELREPLRGRITGHHRTLLKRCERQQTRSTRVRKSREAENRARARRGPKKAILAVVAYMFTAMWHMFSNGVVNADVGTKYLSRLDTDKTIELLPKRLSDLCYHTQPAVS